MIEYFFGPLMYWMIVGNIVVEWWFPTTINPMDFVVELNGENDGRCISDESTALQEHQDNRR